MAFLDVTDITLDPDFMDAGLICHRAVELISEGGIASYPETDLPFMAVVNSDSGENLARNADGSRVKGSISVHTPFILTPGAGDTPADEITWQGLRYTVELVNDYSHYGRGFIHAICTLKPVEG